MARSQGKGNPVSRRFIITGPPRTGTRWLAHELNRAPNAVVTHEAFHPDNIGTGALDAWLKRAPSEGVLGDVNSKALSLLRSVEDIVSCEWGLVWRDPLEQTASRVNFVAHAARAEERRKELVRVWQRDVVRRMMTVAKQINWFLVEAEDLGVPVSHWHLKYFGQQRGFYDLTESFGVSFPWDFRLGAPRGSKTWHIPRAPEWPEEMRQELRERLNDFPRVVEMRARVAREGVVRCQA